MFLNFGNYDDIKLKILTLSPLKVSDAHENVAYYGLIYS